MKISLILLRKFIFLCLVSLIACQPRHSKVATYQDKLVKRFDGAGNLIAEYSLTKDSILNGAYKEFYNGHTLRNASFYKNGIKDSLEIWYYPNGIIEQEYFNKGGKANGIVTNYYSSGAVKSKIYYRDGCPTGSGYFFSENSKLTRYYYYNSDGSLGFRRDYDLDGHITFEDGEAFGEVIQNHSVSTLSVGDTFNAKISIIKPPGQARSLLIYLSSKSGGYLNEKIYLYDAENYLFSYPCRKDGAIKFRISLRMDDSLTHLIDTSYAIQFNLTIKKKL